MPPADVSDETRRRTEEHIPKPRPSSKVWNTMADSHYPHGCHPLPLADAHLAHLISGTRGTTTWSRLPTSS